MYTVQYGGKKGRRLKLVESTDLVVVRTHSRQPISASALSRGAREVMSKFEPVLEFPSAGVEVMRMKAKRVTRSLRDAARNKLKRESDIHFAGRVLCDAKSGAPVLYTENFFVKFNDDCSQTACKKVLKQHSFRIKREVEYLRNAYFVTVQKEGMGLRIFEAASKLLASESVELCHPELVRQLGRREAFPQQWHLKQTRIDGTQINAHSHIEDAWALSEGAGTVIAIIDDGVDMDHEEFAGSNKIVSPHDVTRDTNNPRPGNGDSHGTACAGVACANGLHGASGVAPKARLMPIRFASALGSQDEADSIFWAAQHGADIISCSWGPADGEWWNPNDPLHHQQVPLPDSTRLAIDWAIQNGRNGKGCVITWAAGNGNESVENDGYASYDKVIAVAACNDSSKRSAYSDMGDAIWCAFPSSNGLPSKTSGIWTTDRSGTPGYNPGQTSKGDVAGHYTNSFGGTSSACPGVAGVAALILARNPDLRWDEMKDIIKRSCDQIDLAAGNYDNSGHSPSYGYGRLNALTAVSLAVPSQASYKVVHTAIQDVPIKDLTTSKIAVAVGDTKSIKGIKVSIDIEHTYISDLIIRVSLPSAMGVDPIMLHNRTGGGTDNLKKTYDLVNTSALNNVLGKKPEGAWTLSVKDEAQQDVGKIVSFSVALSL